MNKKIIHIETLGCRLNQIESESVASFFTSSDYVVQMQSITNAQKENLDVICSIVNTCTVTSKAEQKARRIIRLILKKYPNSICLVTGCYAQVNKEEISNIDDRILVIPGRVKSRLINVPKLIKEFCDCESSVNIADLKKYLELNLCKNEETEVSENAFLLSTDNLIKHSRASIKIQDGCNNRCSYCEICIARGKSVSLDVEEILKQIQKIKASGLKEVVFTTVNIAQYFGKYKNSFVNIAGLLEILLKETTGINFRFSSLYPQIVDEKFANLIIDKRVAPHFHLSVQSGSDNILQKMNRPNKAQTVINAVKLLRQARPEAFIACDIIAGFPTETEEDFCQTKKILSECDFTFVHSFPFSPRPNTVAFNLKPKVIESVTRERVNYLIDFSINQKIKYIKKIAGTVRSAIVENTFNKVKVGKNSELCESASNVENLGQREQLFYFNCVTDNFLHCVVYVKDKNLIPSSKSLINVRIIKPLEDRIRTSQEYDCLAELV